MPRWKEQDMGEQTHPFRRVALGLLLLFIGLWAKIVIPFVFIVLARINPMWTLPGGSFNWILLALILASFLLDIAGRILCLWAPAEPSSLLTITCAVAIDLFVLIVSVLSFWFPLLKFLELVRPSVLTWARPLFSHWGALVLLQLSGAVVFLLFLRWLARYVANRGLVTLNTWIIALGISLFIEVLSSLLVPLAAFSLAFGGGVAWLTMSLLLWRFLLAFLLILRGLAERVGWWGLVARWTWIFLLASSPFIAGLASWLLPLGAGSSRTMPVLMWLSNLGLLILLFLVVVLLVRRWRAGYRGSRLRASGNTWILPLGVSLFIPLLKFSSGIAGLIVVMVLAQWLLLALMPLFLYSGLLFALRGTLQDAL
jgi:hypothetical protein